MTTLTGTRNEPDRNSGRFLTGTSAKVITADGLTEIFEILAGVLQGDTLAPYLFVIVVDYIMTVAIGSAPLRQM